MMAKKKKTRASARSTRRAAGKKATKRKTTRKAAKKAARISPPRKKAAPQATAQTPPPPKPGSFVWHELMTGDTARAKDFYSRLFGWKMQDDEMMPGFIYTLITNKGQMIGGMMAITPEQGETPPHWMIYVGVRDVDATAEQCESMGGEIIVPPHDIPVGRWALLQDPAGAKFAVYKRRSR